MLEKKGNSDSSERMDLLERFHKIFPEAEIAYLCGDREFIGQEWVSYLLIEPTIRFRLRIRHSDLISDGQRKPLCIRGFGPSFTWSNASFVRSPMGWGSLSLGCWTSS